MKRTFHGGKVLLRLPLFAALGLAVFLVGWTYSHAHTWLREHIEFDWKAPPVMIKYTGPQNAQELMKALDADYNKGHAKTEVNLSRKDNGIEIERTIESSKEQIERAKGQIEHSKKDLELARKQIEGAQEALEHLKEPTPPQELTPPEKPMN